MPKSYDCRKPPIGGEPRPDEIDGAAETIRAILMDAQPDPCGGHRECYVVRLADQLSEAGHPSLASQWALYKMRQAKLVLAVTRPCTVIDGSGRSVELPGEPSDNLVRAGETLPQWVGPLVTVPEPTDDESSWIAASKVHPDKFKTYKKFLAFLQEHPEIRTNKPSSQRLNVHAGDWARYWASLDDKAFERLDTLDSEFMGDARRRQVDVREKKAGK